MHKLTAGFGDDENPGVSAGNNAFALRTVAFLFVPEGGLSRFEFVGGKTKTVAGFGTGCKALFRLLWW